MRDAAHLELLGIPTVSIITTSFIQLARITSRSLGLPDQCFVVVPHPMGGVSWEVLKAKIDRAFPDILDASTKWSPAKADKKRARPAYPAQTIKIKGNVLDVQRAFLERGWAAGIPFVPPTKDLVEQMLKGTSHPPGEVVWDGVPPRMGVATVELVAACAAMAGCKPEYMPLILAVIEGLKEPAVDIVHQSTTTGTENLLCVVNGPIAKELGLSCGTGAAGLCYHANASIGYAIGLIGKVIGGSKPPDTDKSTLGSPADLFHFVLAENEEESPWEPYAVEHGYKLTDNVVTVKVAYQPLDISEHNSTDGEDILNYTAYSINQPYTICMRHAPVVIGWCPEHAATLAKDGYTKDDIRRYLWEHARYPAKALSKTWWDRGACRPNEDFPDVGYGSQSLLPIVARPEDIQMIVCGGAGKHSQFWPGPKAMASKSIDPWR